MKRFWIDRTASRFEQQRNRFITSSLLAYVALWILLYTL